MSLTPAEEWTATHGNRDPVLSLSYYRDGTGGAWMLAVSDDDGDESWNGFTSERRLRAHVRSEYPTATRWERTENTTYHTAYVYEEGDDGE